MRTENAGRSKPLDEEALKDQGIKRLKEKVCEIVIDLHISKEAIKSAPSSPQMPDA